LAATVPPVLFVSPFKEIDEKEPKKLAKLSLTYPLTDKGYIQEILLHIKREELPCPPSGGRWICR